MIITRLTNVLVLYVFFEGISSGIEKPHELRGKKHAMYPSGGTVVCVFL